MNLSLFQDTESDSKSDTKILNGSSAATPTPAVITTAFDPPEEITTVDLEDDEEEMDSQPVVLQEQTDDDTTTKMLQITETPKRRPKPTTLDLPETGQPLQQQPTLRPVVAAVKPPVVAPSPPTAAKTTLELPGTKSKQRNSSAANDALSSPESPSYSQRPLPLSPQIPQMADIPITSPTSTAATTSLAVDKPPAAVAAAETVPIYSNVKKSTESVALGGKAIVKPAFLASPEGIFFYCFTSKKRHSFSFLFSLNCVNIVVNFIFRYSSCCI